MKTENIKIKDLKEYVLNAKMHPDEQIEGIMQSIKTFGFIQPVVIDAKNEIIIGHGRTKAAHRLGMDEVPCVRVEGLTDAQVRVLRLVDNRIAETGWDVELLNQDLATLDADLSGFNVDFSEFYDIDPDDADLPDLSGDDLALQQVTITLSNAQKKIMDQALKKALKDEDCTDSINQNKNGNAIAAILKNYVES